MKLPASAVRIIKSKRGVLLSAGLFFFLLTLISLCSPGKKIAVHLESGRAWFDREGELLRMDLSSDEKFRVRADLTDYPPEFVELIRLQEDRWFNWHAGVNPAALMRAFYQTYLSSGRRMGASTITMQTARLAGGYNSSRLGGKMRQIWGAGLLEFNYTKKEIMQAYLNLVPCGGNVEGFYSAALYYFGRELEELTLHEMMLLAVIPQDPNNRNPLNEKNHPELKDAVARLHQRWVHANPEQANRLQFLNHIPLLSGRPKREASHFLDTLKERLDNDTGSPVSPRIITTLDRSMQRSVERKLQDYLTPLKEYGIRNASVMIVSNQDHEVRALCGSADFNNPDICGQVDGTTALRSPGSTLKPFIYCLAIEQGLIHNRTVLRDAPTSFGEYTPDNYRSNFCGMAPAWRLLVDSRNIPAIELASRLETPTFYNFLRSGGLNLKPESHYGLSLVLGAAEVSVEQLAALYGSLANNGRWHPIQKIRDTELNSRGRKILSEQAAWITKEMLFLNPPPEGYPWQNIAYKTGTSVGFRDCWAVGFVDQYTVALWVGNFPGEGNNRFIGRLTAAPLLFELAALLRREGYATREESFPPFSGSELKAVAVCETSGMQPGKWCSTKVEAWFIPGVSPIKKCDVHRPVFIDPESGYRLHQAKPGAVTEVYEFWPSDTYRLFTEAGNPRPRPPRFLDDQPDTQPGRPPRILYPQKNVSYVIRYSREDEIRVAVQASADGGSDYLHWYLNDTYIQRESPDTLFEISLKEGTYRLLCIDAQGRSARRVFKVTGVE